MNDRISTLTRRAAIAAAAGGLLFFVSTAAELVHHVSRPDGHVTNLPLQIVYVVLGGAGSASLAVALLLLRSVHRAGRRALQGVGRMGL